MVPGQPRAHDAKASCHTHQRSIRLNSFFSSLSSIVSISSNSGVGACCEVRWSFCSKDVFIVRKQIIVISHQLARRSQRSISSVAEHTRGAVQAKYPFESSGNTKEGLRNITASAAFRAMHISSCGECILDSERSSWILGFRRRYFPR